MQSSFLRRSCLLLALLTVPLLSGCDVGAAVRAAREEAERQALEQERQKSAAATATAFGSVTEEEALRLAVKIESALAAGDASGLSGEFDLDVFGTLVLQQPGYESLKAESFRDGMKRDGMSGEEIIQRMVGEIASKTVPDGSYVRLRLRELNGRKTALFRMITGDGGLNYQEFAFARGQDGRVRIVDVYNYGVGEWMSQSLGRMMIVAFGPLDRRKSRSEIETGSEQLQVLRDAKPLVDRRDSRDFDKIVATLTPEMQRQKFVIVMQIAAAEGQSKRQNAHADRLAELYPDDPATFVMCSQRYVDAERNDEALAMVDKLDAIVGGDPYLSAFRGEILLALNRLPDARTAALAAHEADASIDVPYATLANVAVRERDFEEAASWLRELAVMRQVSAKAARDYACREYSDPDWKAFRDSPAWRKLARE